MLANIVKIYKQLTKNILVTVPTTHKYGYYYVFILLELGVAQFSAHV